MNLLTKRMMNRWLAYSLLLVGLFWLGPGMLEQHYIYFPTHDLAGTPADAGLAYEEVRFTATDDTALTGWLITGDKNAPLVLFCMGNYGNMSHRIGNLALLQRLGLNIFIFDYRGYGQSEGRPDEQGTYHDIRGALAWLQQDGWSPEQMIFFGRSLGAAVVVQAALETPPAGVILETPFTSIPAMGKTHYPLLYLLLGWLVDARYDNLAKVSRLRSPLLLIHGDRDTICPPEMAEQLYDQAPQPKELFWIPGAGHNSTLGQGGSRYWVAWRRFLSEQIGYHARQEV